ncbi:sugar MFS transporter [Chryseobacterium arthrosphaerae]|uniref:Sugar MFS transporter n=1 Tax=Chryseobacterium arthrosphaerae TaxID=651561 RepID=A0ABU7R085_9FLAO|nr:sugar MFS transporter [Chryseobacterium arthrosphaerae]MDG4654346.1 sugar MFS transporter [Chryseobacterium arthrosphaerae]
MINKEVQPQSRNYTVPLITITLLFFMWGFITCMNDILIPYLKQLFSLTFFESMLVQFCFFGAYFIGSLIYFLISISQGDPINKVGYKKGILFGIGLAALGCILFYPAATFSYYPLFLGALFILGLGFTVLQITANAYVSLLGSEDSASSRLNMTQAFNAFGTTIAPVLGGHLIFELFSEPDGTFSAVATRIPYLIFAAILLLVGILISRVKLPSFQMETEETVQGWGALKFSHLKFGVFTMFCYVGGEVAVGSFIISFLEETMKFNEAISKNYLSLYWGGAMIGRFLGAISLNQSISQAKKAVFMLGAAALVFLVIFSIVNLTFDQISFFLVFIVLNFAAFFVGKAAPARTLSIFAAINVILLISTMVSHGEMAMYSVLGIGIFNSIMFSNIYTLAISGLGKYTSQGSSLVVMAILGGAIVPIFQGLLADQFGVQHSFIIPVFCYLVILIFGAYCTKYLGHVENAEAKSGH